jgi:hypothetical protein
MSEGAEKFPDTAHLSTLSDFIVTDNLTSVNVLGMTVLQTPFLQMGPKWKTLDTDNIGKAAAARKLKGIY